MILIALVILLVVLAIFPTIRCALFHPLLMVWNSGRDVWFYFRRKEYNRCSSGELIAFCGLFGKGKTLSAVHKVVRAYHRYDGKPVWCPRRKKMVAQRIHILELKKVGDVYAWEKARRTWAAAEQDARKNLFSSVGIGAHGMTFTIRKSRTLTLHNAFRWRGRFCFLTSIVDGDPGFQVVKAALCDPVDCRTRTGLPRAAGSPAS